MANNWAVQIGISGMTGAGGATIPSSAVLYAGPSGSAPVGLTPVSGQRPLSSTGTTIATGTSSVPAGSQWTISLALTPPGNTPPGVYTATINLDVVSAGP
jgi:hypothetical protein